MRELALNITLFAMEVLVADDKNNCSWIFHELLSILTEEAQRAQKKINKTFSFYFHSFDSFWCIKCVKRCDINFYMWFELTETPL